MFSSHFSIGSSSFMINLPIIITPLVPAQKIYKKGHPLKADALNCIIIFSVRFCEVVSSILPKSSSGKRTSPSPQRTVLHRGNTWDGYCNRPYPGKRPSFQGIQTQPDRPSRLPPPDLNHNYKCRSWRNEPPQMSLHPCHSGTQSGCPPLPAGRLHPDIPHEDSPAIPREEAAW